MTPAPNRAASALQARLDAALQWLLLVGGAASLWLTEKNVGFTRDESVYFAAAQAHARWFQQLLRAPLQALSDGAIASGFDFNHEHPALMKNLFGLSWLVFTDTLHWLRPATSMRLPAFLMAALMMVLIFQLARPLFGRGPALFAAISFFLVPRQFYHAHLSCFDVPIATLWTLVVYAFWRAQTAPRWWLYTGVFFGLALGAKHNALVLPLTLLPFALGLAVVASRGKPLARALMWQVLALYVGVGVLYGVLVLVRGPQGVLSSWLLLSPQTALLLLVSALAAWRLGALGRADAQTFRAVAPLVAIATVGLLVFYLHWPYLWHHPVERTAWWINFHLTHNHYAWFYLGELLREPPFPLEYVLVKTALTVPAAFLVPMALGVLWVLVRLFQRKASWFELLLLANAAVPIALISAPNVPHFGGVKHWFPAMGFLAVLASGSVLRASTALTLALKEKLPLPWVLAFLSTLLCVPGALATAHLYAFGTSAYGELAGGVPGAASLGMQRQYWSNNITGALEWINANARPGDRVYFHECHGGQVSDMVKNGLLRPDVGMAGDPFSADLVAYQYHQEFREQEFQVWEAFGTQKPVAGFYLDETPQVIVYRRKR